MKSHEAARGERNIRYVDKEEDNAREARLRSEAIVPAVEADSDLQIHTRGTVGRHVGSGVGH